MHLAVTFADLIVKIRKEEKPDDNTSYKGVIDQNCIYEPNPEKTIWTGNSVSFSSVEFEQYLCHKQ